MSKKKKILIAYATAGIGHKKAAFAIRDALSAAQKGLPIDTIDVLDYTNILFKKAYPSIYLTLINKLVLIWGLLYYMLDSKLLFLLFLPLRKMLHILNSVRLIKFLIEFKPDMVISTHFLMADLCAYVKKKYRIKIHVMNVITDYKPHSFWISEGVDTYIVAHEETKDQLLKKWAIPERRVKVTGIPIEPKFSIEHDRDVFRKKLDIAQDRFVVLVLSGGYGVGPIFEMLTLMNGLDLPLSIIVVCGHNKKLFTKIEHFKKDAAIHILNLGYVDNVDELMAASDVYIGKAGGISTTEALALDLPLIFIRPIPGQESRNADLIVKKGAGLRLKSIYEIESVLRKLQSAKGEINRLKDNIRKIKKPDAARYIADLAIQMCSIAIREDIR